MSSSLSCLMCKSYIYIKKMLQLVFLLTRQVQDKPSHPLVCKRGLKIGMSAFIISDTMQSFPTAPSICFGRVSIGGCIRQDRSQEVNSAAIQ